jgi:hypothetical protein
MLGKLGYPSVIVRLSRTLYHLPIIAIIIVVDFTSGGNGDSISISRLVV